MRGFGLKFRLFGFPVIIDPSFLLLVVLLYFANLQNPLYGLIIAGCILVSVMIHEFGHAVVGRIFGLKPSIRMTFIGGLTQWSVEEGKTPSNVQHILITLAGPFAGFAFGGIILLYCLVGNVPYEFTLSPNSIVNILLLFNFMWGLANLLPLYPLDGGQVLYYSLRLNKNIPAEQISAAVSLALGGAATFWALQTDNLVIAFLLVWLLSVNFQRLRSSPKSQSGMQEKVRAIQVLMRGEKYKEGLQTTGDLLKTASDERFRGWATEMAALFLDMQDDPKLVDSFTQQHRRHLSTSDAMRFLKLKAAGETEEAMAFASRAIYARPTLTLLAVYVAEMIRQGQMREAYELTVSHKDSQWFDQVVVYIQHQMLTHGGFREVIDLGELAREQHSIPELAYNVACAHARLGAAAESLRWLEEAVRRGYRDHAEMSTDEDLQLLWDHHAFIDLLARMKELADRDAASRESEDAVSQQGNALSTAETGKE